MPAVDLQVAALLPAWLQPMTVRLICSVDAAYLFARACKPLCV